MKDLQLLTNGKTTKELVKQDTHDNILISIDEYLKSDKFNYIVTADNLKEVKSNNAELNKTIKFIKDFSKQLIDAESKDINTFKSNIKDYVELIETKRQNRLKDIEVFESEIKDTIKTLLFEYTENEVKSLNIRDEFNNINYNDLIIVSHITGKGALTKACKDKLDIRIQKCKSNQDRYDMRLLQLENICYQNGLETPLTVNHVQGIIYEENEDIYQSKLTGLINDEIERVLSIKKQLEIKAKEDAEKKAKAKVEDQMQEAKNTFLNAYGMMEIETLENELKRVSDIDINKFDLCIDYAKRLKDDAITKINQAIYAKTKALEETKEVIETLVDVEKDANIPNATYRDILPFENIEIEEQNIESKNKILPNGNEVYNIKALFQVEASPNIDYDFLTDEITKILNNAGIDKEDIVKVEVL